MHHRQIATVTAIALTAVSSARADGILLDYDGSVHPAEAGWQVANGCESSCVERTEDGVFVVEWPKPGSDPVSYILLIASPGEPLGDAAPPFWIEWRYRSNQEGPQLGAISCDGRFQLQYASIMDGIWIFGGVGISGSGGQAVALDPLEAFHTFRFESPDGLHYAWYADGQLLDAGQGRPDCCPTLNTSLRFGGDGTCGGGLAVGDINEWDYVRYGRLEENELFVSADPPSGNVPLGFDRFSVGFDAPNYLYVDDVSVSSDSNLSPTIAKSWRLDHHGPGELEIVLSRSLIVNETITVTIGEPPDETVLTYHLPPVGACCDRSPGAGGFCEDGVLEEECPVEFTLAATCDAVECVETTGSCCDERNCTCAVSLIGDCTGPRESWIEGATCSPDPCTCATGACCDRDERACTDGVTRPDCTGDWFEGLSCDEVDADPDTVCRFTAIPAVGTWGIAALALSLLVAAKVMSRRLAGV